MKLQSLNFVCLLLAVSIFLSCTGDGEDTPTNNDLSNDQIGSISAVLNLPETPFNYSNLPLPPHFQSADALELDNTPEDNPVTDWGATLGRVLFYDTKLSVDNSISCASCHKQNEGFSDNDRLSLGINGQRTKRNSMTLINSRYYENGRFMWDERATSLEEQVLMPIQDHTEMGMNLNDLVIKLQQQEYYEVLFEKAFDSPQVTTDRIAMALSQFTRSIISYRTKFDEGLVMAGNPEVYETMPLLPNFTEQENLGLDIFMKGRNGGTCGYCHGTGMNVNDVAKNNGLSLSYTDKGKGAITGNASDFGLFKVPSLRNITQTAPYMHDGRFETLRQVVDHYSDNVQNHANLNFRLTNLDDGAPGTPEPLRLNLNEQEKEALIAFLRTLTDRELAADEKYSNPFKE